MPGGIKVVEKPTYEELQQRINELEREIAQRDARVRDVSALKKRMAEKRERPKTVL